MKKKTSLILDNEFLLYCEINKIDDIEKLAKETFNRGFSLLKYPDTPLNSTKQKIVEKIVEIEKEVIREVPVEKIVEVIKEVPVEKIIEVVKEVPVEKIVEVVKEVAVQVEGETKIITNEIIKEVPVEKIVEIIKEVPVEKIIKIENTEEIEKLKKENFSLKEELDNLKKSLDKLNRATYMKNSDLGSLYDE